jgi:hypothetical protein
MDAIAAVGVLVMVAVVLVVYVTLFQNKSVAEPRKVIIIREDHHDSLSWQPWYRVGRYGGPHGYHG